MIKEWHNAALLLACDLDVRYVHLRPPAAVRLETLASKALSHYGALRRISISVECFVTIFVSNYTVKASIQEELRLFLSCRV